MQDWAKKMNFLGMFPLTQKQAGEVKDLVYFHKDGTFSRGRSYYYGKHAQEKLASQRRELFSRLWSADSEEAAAVLADRMLKISGDVTHAHKGLDSYDWARKCLDEDVARFLEIMDGKNPTSMKTDLPINSKLGEIRVNVESQNNFKILKMFMECLPPDIKNTTVITAGYGGIYIGPAAKHVLGTEYHNLRYSGRKNGDNLEHRSLSHFIDPSKIGKSTVTIN